jgi:YbbR domain-containing protein
VLRNLFLHNVLLKVVSIGIAFGLWFFVNAAQRDSEAEYPIAVRLTNLPAHLLMVSPRTDTVDLHLSGPRTLLNRIEGANVGIEIDLSRVRVGATTFRLRPDTLPLPRGVTPIRITPSEITLEFDRIEGKRVPVQVAVDGRPAGDLRITESKVTPEEVEIRGPSRVVRDISVAKTVPLDLSDAVPGRIRRDAQLDFAAEFLTVSSPSVHVDLLLEEPIEEGKTDPIVIVVRNAVGDATVDPREVTLQVRGPRSRVQALELPNGAVYVDAQGLASGRHRLQPLTSLPAGIELARDLKTVTVKIGQATPALTPTDASSDGSPGLSPLMPNGGGEQDRSAMERIDAR